MHSKKSDPSDIESFMKAWNNQGPVIIVPTKYYTTPTDTFRDLGVSMVIWANHNLRAAVSAMQQVTGQIYKDQSLVNVEKEVGSQNISLNFTAVLKYCQNCPRLLCELFGEHICKYLVTTEFLCKIFD